MTATYLDHLDRLLADPLHVARESAQGGKQVVGYVGDEIPVALILAAGAIPVAVRADVRAPTPRADEILESAFTPELRAIAERWLCGDLDFLAAVVFPRADDSAQRLYYYLCELQRRGRCGGPRPLLYDIAKIARPASAGHSRDATRRLAHELGSTTTALPDAVRRVARRESLIADLRARCQADEPLSGAVAWRIRQAAGAAWCEDFDAATQRWLASAPALHRQRRVVLAGAAPPDDSLHAAIEGAGGSVVVELNHSFSPLPTDGIASLDALADQFHAQLTPVLAMREDADWLAHSAREARADAVVCWLIEEDEAMPWEISRQMRRLHEERIPALLLARQRRQNEGDALRQLTQFVGALGKPR
jgi:hypothetical protein